jgi:hypothetical protein
LDLTAIPQKLPLIRRGAIDATGGKTTWQLFAGVSTRLGRILAKGDKCAILAAAAADHFTAQRSVEEVAAAA